MNTATRPQPRLLFFYHNNPACESYFISFVKRYSAYIYGIDLTPPVDKFAAETARNFGVRSVPCLILIDTQGYEMQRWQGGVPPDNDFIRVEIGVGNAWGL